MLMVLTLLRKLYCVVISTASLFTKTLNDGHKFLHRLTLISENVRFLTGKSVSVVSLVKSSFVLIINP